MEFKVGDKVKVVHMPSECDGGFPKEMLGKIVTIDDVWLDLLGVIYTINKNRWCSNFIESDLEHIRKNLMDLEVK